MSSVLDSTKRIAGNGLIALLTLVLSTTYAHAGPFGSRHTREGSKQAGGQFQQQASRNGKRPYSQPNERRENQASQRLSPEERQQLRRDIQDAGREIYPARR